MNKEFDKMENRLRRQFGKDRNMAMATSYKDIPTVRIVDTYYENGALYIVTHESLEKVKQIEKKQICKLSNESECVLWRSIQYWSSVT